MKKISNQLLFYIFVVILIVGCNNKGIKDNNSSNESNNSNANVNEKTKVNNLSESFTKYSEVKSKKMELLTEMSQKSDNHLLAMALIPIGMSDLTVVPASVCGLNETEAVGQLFLFKNVTYNMNDNKCTVTYTDQREISNKFIAIYDYKTDSVTMDVYEDNVHILTSEYTKVKDGYATQFYSTKDGEDNVTVYQTLFDKNNIYTSVFENASKPESIFKNSNINNDFAKNGNYLYIEIINGLASGKLEGETLNFNN